MNQSEEIIKKLRGHQELVANSNRQELHETVVAVMSLCQRFYSKGSAFETSLKLNRDQLQMLILLKRDRGEMGMPGLEDLKDTVYNLFGTIISEIETLGLPSKNDLKIDKSVNVNVNQHQNQTIELRFIEEVLRDELNGKQLREIREIVSRADSNSAKPELKEKMKEFGLDVTSGILSSLISNPSIWALLGGR